MSVVLRMRDVVSWGQYICKEWYSFNTDLQSTTSALISGSLGLVTKCTHKNSLVLQRIQRRDEGGYYSASDSCTEQTHYRPIMKGFWVDKGTASTGKCFSWGHVDFSCMNNISINGNHYAALHQRFTPEQIAISHRWSPLKICSTGRIHGEGLCRTQCRLSAHE